MPTQPPGQRCTVVKKTGEPCNNWAVRGATVCDAHGGLSRHIRVKAAVRDEVYQWGLGDVHEDPGEVLLRMVTQSANRCEMYSAWLREAYEAAEALRVAYEHGDLLVAAHTDTGGDRFDEPAAVQRAREDLDRIFITGGVSALIGHKYTVSASGSVVATEECIRGLAKLEADERDRCVNFAAKAVAAGLAKRQVEMAEAHGRLIADVLRAILDEPELGLTDAQKRALPDVADRHLSIAR